MRVVSEDLSVMVELHRTHAHRSDEDFWDAKLRPNWTIQIGYEKYLSREATLQFYVLDPFITEWDITFKVKRNSNSSAIIILISFANILCSVMCM